MPESVQITYTVNTVQILPNSTEVQVVEAEKVEVVLTPLGERGPSGASEGMLWSSNNW